MYLYKDGKKRIEEILNNNVSVQDVDSIPSDDNFTFDNSYYSWVTALFVDIRNSSKLFTENDKVVVSKIIRVFTSEIIEILKNDSDIREIGIRGDCVYAIFSTPYKQNISSVANYASCINTELKMLNKLLERKRYPNIYAGIGISSAKELIVKAGRKYSGINSKVWIGEAVTKASNLSSLGNKNYIEPIVMASITYDNIIDIWKEENSDAPNWFKFGNSNEYGAYYHCNVVQKNFDDWINRGMPDE